MRVQHSGTSPLEAKRLFHSGYRGRIVARAKAEADILDRVWREVLAPGPRGGRMYRHHGRLVRASAPGEVPQSVSGRLRNSPRISWTVRENSRGYQGVIAIDTAVSYAARLIRLRRVITAAVIERAKPALARLAWPR